jgi:hypothetical protein
VLTHRHLIASLVFVWSLGGILNAFSHCLLESDLRTNGGGQISVSISCLDNQGHPFLAQVAQRDKRVHFSKIEKRPTDSHHKALLPGGAFHLAPFPSSASILVSLSVPIYQLTNVYRI